MQVNRWAGIVLGLAAVAVLFGVYNARAAGSRSPAAQEGERVVIGQGVSASGTGFVEARPDTAYITLGFTAQNASVVRAQNEVAETMNAIIAKIRALGVAEKDIQTSNHTIWRDQERKVFVVGNDVRVTVRDIDSSAQLLDEAVQAGANSVQGISFGIENRTALERQARERAMADARSKATELARLGGVALGEPVSISEGVSSPPPIIYERMAGDMAAAEAGTPIEPGQLRVDINVQVTFAIK